MLDVSKIEKDAIEYIHSFTREQLLEFVDWYNQEIALAKKEERKERMGATRNTVKVNGAPHSAAKSKGVPVKKTTRSRATVKA